MASLCPGPSDCNVLRLAGSLARRPDEDVKVFQMGGRREELFLQGSASHHGVEIG
jgi:hypothetical protein